MDSNFRFNISTNAGNYEFYVAKDSNLSSGYSISPLNEKNLPTNITKIFKQAAMEGGSLTIEMLANRLQLLPGVLSVNMTTVAKTNTVSIPTILQDHAKSMIHSMSIDEIGANIADTLKTTCPNGAGSIVMVSRPKEGSVCVSAGTTSVGGAELNGQTAALIGSASKIFTSLCCMALISRGAVNKMANPPQLLTLDTKISDVFSDKQMLIFEDQVKAKEVTLGMLLSHTSGLVYFADDNRDEREGMSLSKILEDDKKRGTVKFYGHPGDKIYSYSNHIGLAAAMLEIAFDKPYYEILKEEILAPLGMTRTSYDCPADNVLLAYKLPLPDDKEGSPSSEKMEVKDPMMQGAGGLWSCMDDIEKLGKALGLALSEKLDLTDPNGQIVITSANLQNMMCPQSINAPCGFAFDLQGDVVGKGGGIHGYDFKLKIDTKSGCCVSMMCNHAGKGKFKEYLDIASDALQKLNPAISFDQTSKTSPVKKEVKELPIEECSQRFKGFAGCLAFPDHRPLISINYNGTTLPIEQKPHTEIEGLKERYLIVGDSPFQGKELLIYQRNQHLYPCLSDLSEGLEVWSFGQTLGAEFPVVTKEIFEKLASASGDYIDKIIGGPPPRQIRVDSEKGLTLSFPDSASAPAKCLITKRSANEVSFVACPSGGPQDCSYKLIKNELSDWNLVILNAETEDIITTLPQTKILL